MTHFKRIALLLVVFLSVIKTAKAVDLGYAKEDAGNAGAFLDFAASARSLGMGRAHAGVADDASAIYWNPAGLAQLERKDLVTMYSVLYENTGFGSFSYAHPMVDYGTLGLGVVNLRSTNYDRRDINAVKQGSFATSQTGVLLSHGINLTNDLNFGTTVKVINEQVASNAGVGYGVDFGGLWKWNERMQLGLVAHNVLAPKVKLREIADEYPRDIRLGMKVQALNKLMIAADVNQTEDRGLKTHIGGEWTYNKTLALRVGLNESEVSAGLGIQIGRLGLDYAFGFQDAVGGVSDLGSSHRFGFHFVFGGKVSDQEVSQRWQRKGQTYLATLKTKMDEEDLVLDNELQKAVVGARQVIRQQGFIRPQDLYAAQGYISFFEGQYERSVQSFGESVVLDPENEDVANHLRKARAQMTEGRKREIVNYELKRVKELYDAGNWKATVKSCEKILSFRPGQDEALVYLQDAQARIMEPINRELKIGRTKFENRDYFEAIKRFQKVKEMDPDNKEATQYISYAIASLEKQSQVQARKHSLERPVYEIARDADKSRNLYSQGLLLYSQGKIQQAADVWSQAVKYDNENVLARNAYTRAQIELEERP